MQFRFHVVGLPHTNITKEFMPCAYTQKVLNFSNMMHSLGHSVVLYGGSECDAQCEEHVSVMTAEDQHKFFGHVDWRKDFFPIVWDPNIEYWRLMNQRVIAAIAERKRDKTDFIVLVGGDCQRPIMDAHPELTTSEPFVGYRGICSRFRVFESYAFMHYLYGIRGVEDGFAYDAVIPNYYDMKDFPVSADQVTKDSYLLFVGRMVSRKGIETAIEMARLTGRKLIMAGQGVIEQRPGLVRSIEYSAEGDFIEHIGTIDAAQRNELMARAHAVVVPTNYIGPFEGVHAEAMLCGTPVITTDWGVFPETVRDGVNGYRCRTLGEFVKAVDLVGGLDSGLIRALAIKNFSTDTVKHSFNDYYTQLHGLWGQAWYDMNYFGEQKRKFGVFS